VTATFTAIQQDLIDGNLAEPQVRLDAELADANTGEHLAHQRQTEAADLERALAAADRVHRSGSWLDLGAEGRAERIAAFAAALRPLEEAIAQADARLTGVPITVTRMMAGSLADTLVAPVARVASGACTRDMSVDGRPVWLDRIPRGPAAVLVPWNAPLGVATTKIAHALAVGCPVILKAPEWAPASCSLFAQAAEAGLPPGVFQLVHGGPAVGSALVADPRIAVISFTGGTATGRDIAASAAPRLVPVHLELSGNNPAVVLDDADPTAVAAQLVPGAVKLNGQWCEAPRRVYVPKALHDDLVAAMLARMRQETMGSSLSDTTTFGPLSHRAHLNKVRSQVGALVAAGATATAAMPAPEDNGCFFAPTVVTGAEHDGSAQEIFGPVVIVIPVADDRTAVALANDSQYGLAGYVFGAKESRALEVGRRLRVGEVKINGTSLLNLAPDAEQSFFGLSGVGGHGSEESFRLFTGARMTGVDDPSWPI